MTSSKPGLSVRLIYFPVSRIPTSSPSTIEASIWGAFGWPWSTYRGATPPTCSAITARWRWYSQPISFAVPLTRYYAWRKHRITHRDVKPANILVGLGNHERAEAVKLADFGIAKAIGKSTTLTSARITIGTMAYIAPERLEGHEPDNRADIYSLGCTAFQLLTGSTPYDETSISAMMAAHLYREIPAITQRANHLPGHLDSVFRRALAKNPADRYPTCREFVDELLAEHGTAASELPTLAAPGTPASPSGRNGVRAREISLTPVGLPRRSLKTLALVAAVMLVAVVGIALSMAETGTGTKDSAVGSTNTPSRPDPPTLPPHPTLTGPIAIPIADIFPTNNQIRSITGIDYEPETPTVYTAAASLSLDNGFTAYPQFCASATQPTSSVWRGLTQQSRWQSGDTTSGASAGLLDIQVAFFPSEQAAARVFRTVSDAVATCGPTYKINIEDSGHDPWTYHLVEISPGRPHRVSWLSGPGDSPTKIVTAYSNVGNAIVTVSIVRDYNPDLPDTYPDKLVDIMLANISQS